MTCDLNYLPLEQVKNALEQLGYKNPDFTVKRISSSIAHLFDVELNGNYFGIWNTIKKTFID